MPRKNKYELYVEPYLNKISDMCLSMTEAQIAQTLNVSYSAFRKYKEEHKELRTALKNGRRELVYQLKSTLIRKAKGFYYEEETTVYEYEEETKHEIKKRYAVPDVAAINLLLKNYDKDWRNDPAEYELKKQALELQKQKLEQEQW